MHRRNFIKLLFAGAGILGGSAAISYMRMKDESVMRNAVVSQQMNGLTEKACDILFLASLAPSGHNAQPWTVTVKAPFHWLVGTDPARRLPAVDPDNREALLSLGAFLENLSRAAEARGYKAEISVPGKQAFSPVIAEVNLSECRETVSFDRQIKERRTVRNQLLSQPLVQEDIAALIGPHREHILFYPLHSGEGANISEAVIAANRQQAERPDVQAELAEWIRWSDTEALHQRNGLTPESMEMTGIVRWYAKNFMDKDDVQSAMFKEESVKAAEQQARNCAGWMVVTGGQKPGELLKAGGMLQTAWLSARERGVALHPMTQVLEEEAWRRELSTALGLKDAIQFIVRTGYIKKYPLPVSLRMPLEAFVTGRMDG